MITYRAFGAEQLPQVLSLYRDAGWTAYLDSGERMSRALERSLFLLGAFEEETLVGFIRCVGDGEHILYVNGEYRGESNLGKLMHDFNCTQASDMNFELMAERTRYLKEDPKGVSEMCRIMEDMRKSMDEEIKNVFLSQFPQFDIKPKEVNFIDELQRMKDKMTTVIFCNSEKQEELQAAADKESVFWKIIGVPYIENGQAVVIKDEKLKMSILQGERIREQK